MESELERDLNPHDAVMAESEEDEVVLPEQ